MAQPNGFVASVLLEALEKVVAAEGVPGCTVEQAKERMHFAEDHLLTLTVADKPPVPPSERHRPCRFLGPQLPREIGRAQGCFECVHPYHRQTTRQQCLTCPEYASLPSPGIGSSMVWAVGMTTAPRRRRTLRRTLKSLRQAGWDQEVHLFAEAGSATVWETMGLGPLRLIRRAAPALGAWPSFLLGLAELYLRTPHADVFFMLQDDAVFASGLRRYLESSLWPSHGCGCVSLHTPRHLASDQPGFFAVDVGWQAWGAQALAFPNEAVQKLLGDRRVIEHRQRGIGDGLKNVDSVVGDWCRRSNRPFYLHSPSLVEHVGLNSTLWPRADLRGRRSSKDFPGENVDIVSFMAERHPSVATPVATVEREALFFSSRPLESAIQAAPEPPPAALQRPIPEVECVVVAWRAQNLERIISAFRNQSVPCRLTIVTSERMALGQPVPERLLQLADRVYRTSEEFGAFNRFFPAFTFETEFVYLHDDDMLPGHRLIEHFLQTARQLRDFGVLGQIGRRLTADGYNVGHVARSGQPEPVDVVIRGYFLPTCHLPGVLDSLHRLGLKPGRDNVEDDLVLAWTMARQSLRCWLTPADADRETSMCLAELPASEARSLRGNHYATRNAFVRKFWKKEWICQQLQEIHPINLAGDSG